MSLNLHFTADKYNPKALAYKEKILKQYNQSPIEKCEAVVAIGGDGFMLRILHSVINIDKPVFGINFGSIGFLMNKNTAIDIESRIINSNNVTINALHVQVNSIQGEKSQFYAFNEVSLLRQLQQASKIKITIDDKPRMNCLICDGIIVSTAAGSTAYNFSALGPILPITSNLIALTPISAFRPRRWLGALLPRNVSIQFDILEYEKRPVSLAADYQEIRNIKKASVKFAHNKKVTLLFDAEQSLSDRIVAEQFAT